MNQCDVLAVTGVVHNLQCHLVFPGAYICYLAPWLLQEQTISDKFAGLSEALQVAESKAREATEMRKQVALEMARRQKLAKDEQMRKLALQARMERGGPIAAATAAAGGGLASRLDTGGAGAVAGGGPYPGPPPASAAGGGGHDRSARSASPASSDDDDRRRGGRGNRRGRDEYEETAEVSRTHCVECMAGVAQSGHESVHLGVWELPADQRLIVFSMSCLLDHVRLGGMRHYQHQLPGRDLACMDM